jgi:hypothetical protein
LHSSSVPEHLPQTYILLGPCTEGDCLAHSCIGSTSEGLRGARYSTEDQHL